MSQSTNPQEAGAGHDLAEKLRHGTKFLGHPSAVGTLSFMNLCNGFAYGGMSAILIYFLYKPAPEGLGFTEAEASQLISLYSTAALLCGLVGSYMADRVLGPRKALRLGRITTALAYVVISLPFLGVFGYAANQILLCVAAMITGRSVETLAGKMYDKQDKRRDGAFSMLYIINNVGGVAPLIAGTIALATGYYPAFALCAVFAVLGVVAYLLTEKQFFGPIGALPDDPVPPAKRTSFTVKVFAVIVVVVALMGVLLGTKLVTIGSFTTVVSTCAIFIPIVYLAYIMMSKKTTRPEAKRLSAIIPLFVCNVFAMWVWTQSTSILATYADTTVDRNLFGMEITPAAFGTWSAALAVIFGIVVTTLWTRLGDHQPTVVSKMGFGTILWGAGPLFMAIPFVLYPAGQKVSPLWLLVFYVFIMLGEAITSPSGYSAASLVAPLAFSTQMMTVWSISQSTGAALNAISVNFYHEGSEAPYFAAIGGITILVGLIVLVFTKKLGKIITAKVDTDVNA
ncbi:amino acid transporter [Bifidobacterium ramosum]|uniref:Amino acid transporter n=1 Tax=Bifidobacterium ramosum TaxID=1798158 RepID=A0A6L4X222_9BIFI|nr:oligopeptide:H+ symporter [Bifidobacterium ramosum]KAB8289051.1 amino acid transporter [Bifidobacterium ramosum]NEG70765.1 MFS transporter [Bifidobacterium ramosum]